MSFSDMLLTACLERIPVWYNYMLCLNVHLNNMCQFQVKECDINCKYILFPNKSRPSTAEYHNSTTNADIPPNHFSVLLARHAHARLKHMSCHIIYHIISYHIISFHIISYHISYHIYHVMSCPVMSCYIMLRCVMWCHIIPNWYISHSYYIIVWSV